MPCALNNNTQEYLSCDGNPYNNILGRRNQKLGAPADESKEKNFVIKKKNITTTSKIFKIKHPSLPK